MSGLIDRKGKVNDEINELNTILEELLGDARDFAGDMVSGIYMYFIVGLMSVIFGILAMWQNRYYIMLGDALPILIVVGAVFSGAFIISKGFQLKNKYSKIFELLKKLGNG